MAIIPETQFPDKITPASVEYPLGKARNITLPSDGTGTPWKAAFANDVFGFQQALLSEAGIVASGTPDNVTNSQYLQSLRKLTEGAKLLSQSLDSSDINLTEKQAHSGIIVFDGVLTANVNVTIPDDLAHKWIVINNTTGSFSVTLKTLTGSGVIVPQGSVYGLYSDGTNVVKLLGTVSSKDVGVDDGNVVVLEDVDGSPGLPSVDGSQLLGMAEYVLPLTTAATSATGFDYHAEPRVVELNDGVLLMIHQRATAHDNNSVIIVARRSTDKGVTWSAPITVCDPVSGFAGRNPGVSHDVVSNRVTVFVREYNSPVVQVDVLQTISTDGGLTWGTKTSIFSLFSPETAVAPFGKAVATSNGLMQLFYTADKCWALFSTDNGVTWGSKVTVYDLTQVLATFNEPFVVALDENRLAVVIREDIDKDRYFIAKSPDGGLTWPVVFAECINISAGTTIENAAPAAMAVVGNEIYCVWMNRALDYTAYLMKMNKEYFWRRPTQAFNLLGGEPTKRQWRSRIVDGDATNLEYGYPDLTVISGATREVLLSWYDSKDGNGVTDTEILCMTTVSP